jgi:hypothetical protein
LSTQPPDGRPRPAAGLANRASGEHLGCVADRDNTTLLVAVAGIAATALVGLAGTGAAWVSARDDRHTQERLARAERSYNRRVAVYLDAIDLLEAQKATYEEYSEPGTGPGIFTYRRKIPLPYPPRRLTTRLRAFGSSEAFKAFQRAEFLRGAIPNGYGCCTKSGEDYILALKDPVRHNPPKAFFEAYKPFKTQLARFEEIVHNEIGG